MDNAGAKFPNQFNRDCFLSDVAFGLECIHDMGRRDGRFEQLEAIRQMTFLPKSTRTKGSYDRPGHEENTLYCQVQRLR